VIVMPVLRWFVRSFGDLISGLSSYHLTLLCVASLFFLRSNITST
jgi:hypothetical protein